MIGAVVLAAGASSRMGRSKAELPVGRTTFLARILATLAQAGVTPVRVVVGPQGTGLAREVGLDPSSLVVNPYPEGGMLSSVRCGIRALPEEVEGFLVWPVDHPLVHGETVQALVRAFAGGGRPIVVPSRRGRRGHPVLFPARLREELLAAPDDVGARAVVRAHEGEIALVEVDDDGVVDDIDTPGDYARAVGRPLS